jgi:XTP/dITP diphosphohydrolase
MEIWIGTTNRGKLSEIRPLLEKDFPQATVHSIGELSTYSQPPENGQTYLDNARIKAKSLRALKPNSLVIAEDSGLEAEGLGGLPGIHSARYAGPRASDAENNAKLLKMLKIRSSVRSARFVCQLVAYLPSGEEILTQGVLLGEILQAPRGQMGFGYDPLFVPQGQSQTMAELGYAFKNKESHRAQAVKTLIEILHSKGF